MASKYYDTQRSNWKFWYSVSAKNKNRDNSSKLYTFTFELGLWSSNANWYKGAEFDFVIYINNTKYTFERNVGAGKQINFPANVDHVVTTWSKDVDLGYRFSDENINVSASFTVDVSPYGSSGGPQSVTIKANAKNVIAPTVSLKDNGNNTATITLSGMSGNTNNGLKSYGCNYNIDGAEGQFVNQNSKKVTLYSKAKKLNVTSVYSKGNLGDTRYGTTKSIDVKFYDNPTKPTDLDIRVDNNIVTLSAKMGSGVKNNSSTGVEMYYTTDGTDPKISSTRKQYSTPFGISSDTTIKMAARTIGTYTGNNKAYYYSGWSDLSSAITAYSYPDKPTSLQIVNNGDNSFCIKCIVGRGGLNNTSDGVEIYYTTDGTSPNINSSQKIIVYGSEYNKVTTINIPVSEDIIVKAIARTKGVVSSFMYSDVCDKKQEQIYYYEKPILYNPIINYDKKLTKKSTITVDCSVTPSCHTAYTGYIFNLYHNNEEIIKNKETKFDVPYTNNGSEIFKETTIVNLKDMVDAEGKQIKFKKGDILVAEILYHVYPILNETDGSLNNQYQLGDKRQSIEHDIQSNGIMRVKQNDSWYEGQVWVNVDGIWREATDVLLNVDGSWKESV